MKNLFDIKDNVTVITGGTGVLGSAIAQYLVENGARVIIIGRNAEKGKAIVASLSYPFSKGEGHEYKQPQETDTEHTTPLSPRSGVGGEAGSIEFIQADVLQQEQMEQACEYIISKYARVDTLLNAAGGNQAGATIGPDQNIFDLQPEAFQQVLQLNLTGTVIPTQVFLRPMAAQGKGSIINFSSMSAFRPLTRVCGYSAAKAGINNFTAYMAAECAKKFGEGIRVNAIAPGFFITEQNRSLLTNPDGTYTERGKDVIRQTPFGRMGQPEELCGTIHYLMSPASRFVTGTVAVVDGGFNVFAM